MTAGTCNFSRRVGSVRMENLMPDGLEVAYAEALSPSGPGLIAGVSIAPFGRLHQTVR